MRNAITILPAARSTAPVQGVAVDPLSATTLGNEHVQVRTCDVRREVVTCR